MRILLALGWYLPGSLGGTEVYVAALCRRLRAAGHDVQVAAPLAGLVAPRTDEHEGVRVLRYPVPARPTRAEAQGEVAARGSEALAALLAAERFDVVHLHTVGLGLGPAEARAARASGARLFVTAHESRLGHLCQRGTLMRNGEAPCDGVVTPAGCAACVLGERGLPRWLASGVAALSSAVPPIGALAARLPGRAATALAMPRLVERNLARQRELLSLVERFVVLTEAARAIVVAAGAPADKVIVNRLGVDRPPLDEGAAVRPPVTPPLRVEYLGRFDRVKGPQVLAAAVARLDRSVPIQVSLRGPIRDPGQRAVADEVRRAAAGDPRLTIEPEVAAGEVPARLRALDVLCCPSLCLEGGPTVALEAHAAGTPVVGSRIGGLAELVDERWGALVPPGDAAALAALLERMARDPAGTVERWRPVLPRPRTMDEVAAATLAMYQGPRR